MGQGFHNAAIQANATDDSSRRQAMATTRAAQMQIEHDDEVRRAQQARLVECIESFAALDARSLPRMTDKELARFHAEYPPGSPQYALALNEWNRRLVTRQVRATRFSAFVGVLSAVIGVLLGWMLSSYDPEDLIKQLSSNANAPVSMHDDRVSTDTTPPTLSNTSQEE